MREALIKMRSHHAAMRGGRQAKLALRLPIIFININICDAITLQAAILWSSDACSTKMAMVVN